MDSIDKYINLYGTAFTISMIIAIVAFAVAVLLFFVFDIKTIFQIKIGRAKSKQVKAIEEGSAASGQLKKIDFDFMTSDLKTARSRGRSGRIRNRSGRLTDQRQQSFSGGDGTPSIVEHTMALNNEFTVMHGMEQEAAPVQETSLLQESGARQAADMAESYQAQTNGGEEPYLVESAALGREIVTQTGFHFRITEDTLVIHTSEIIL